MGQQTERSRMEPETTGQAGQQGPMNTGGVGGFIRANLLVWRRGHHPRHRVHCRDYCCRPSSTKGFAVGRDRSSPESRVAPFGVRVLNLAIMPG